MDTGASKRIIDKVSALILLFWASALAIRWFVAPLETVLIISSIICGSVFFLCHLCVVYIRNTNLAGSILLSVLCTSVLFLTWLAGGIDTNYIAVYPFVPIIAALLFGRALSWTLCSIMCVAVIAFYLIKVNTADFEVYSQADELEDRLTAVWNVISIVVCTTFANFFHGENIRLNDALENQARIDYLTGLPNKRAIEECLKRESALAKRTGGWISVIMLDIDFFKRYNDSFGHAKGDECLKLIADSLKRSLKRADDFVGRYGGEEFIVLLPDTDPDSCMKIAETMRKKVGDLHDKHSDILQESVSITLGCFSTTGETLLSMDDLVSRADRALYDGKRLGRNRVISSVDKKIEANRKAQAITNINERRSRRRNDPLKRS